MSFPEKCPKFAENRVIWSHWPARLALLPMLAVRSCSHKADADADADADARYFFARRRRRRSLLLRPTPSDDNGLKQI